MKEIIRQCLVDRFENIISDYEQRQLSEIDVELNYEDLKCISECLQFAQLKLDRQENKPIEHVADIEEQEWYWLKHLETNKIVCIHVDRFLDARATGYDTHIIISEKQRYSLDTWEIYKHKPVEETI